MLALMWKTHQGKYTDAALRSSIDIFFIMWLKLWLILTFPGKSKTFFSEGAFLNLHWALNSLWIGILWQFKSLSNTEGEPHSNIERPSHLLTPSPPPWVSLILWPPKFLAWVAARMVCHIYILEELNAVHWYSPSRSGKLLQDYWRSFFYPIA